MVLTTQQASESLGEVAAAQRKARQLQGYSKGAPHFLLWGLIWALGYSGTEFVPQIAGKLWLVLDAIGIVGSFLIARAAYDPAVRSARSVNFLAIGFAFIAFWGATFYILQPQTNAQVGAFPALLMAFVYTCVGTFAGARWLVIGIALWILTVAGYVLVPAHFMLWMAIVGGGALLLTGAWMRRV